MRTIATRLIDTWREKNLDYTTEACYYQRS
jgi:hypothetical protein